MYHKVSTHTLYYDSMILYIIINNISLYYCGICVCVCARVSGVVPEPKSQVEEAGTLRTNPTSQKSLCLRLRLVRAASH